MSPWTRQRAEARKAWAGSGEAATEAVWFALRERAGPANSWATRPRAPKARSSPWSSTAPTSKAPSAGAAVAVVCNQTPFYGEGGGQVGDVGTIRSASGALVGVSRHPAPARRSDRPSRPGRDRHAELGDDVVLDVDHDRRQATRGNHSVTHLLHGRSASASRRDGHAEGLDGGAGADALRHQLSQRHRRRRNWRRSRPRSTRRSATTARSKPI